jgi:hypothetical protein
MICIFRYKSISVDINMELRPHDLSFLRSEMHRGGSARATTVPSLLMRLDARYNFSRHHAGPRSMRSDGSFMFLDLIGSAVNYLLWRRSESHAIIPHTMSMRDSSWSPDDQQTIKAAGVPESLYHAVYAPRIHPLNALTASDWLSTMKKYAPLGVDLIIALPEKNFDEFVSAPLSSLVSESLAIGGDLVCPVYLLDENPEWTRMFTQIYESKQMLFCIGKRDKMEKKSVVVEKDDYNELCDVDLLNTWIYCNA